MGVDLFSIQAHDFVLTVNKSNIVIKLEVMLLQTVQQSKCKFAGHSKVCGYLLHMHAEIGKNIISLRHESVYIWMQTIYPLLQCESSSGSVVRL